MPDQWKIAYYPEARFGGFSNVDGTVVFYNRVNALLQPEGVALDVGCGRGAYGEDPIPFRRELRILRGKCAHLIGVDVEASAAENPYIDEFRLIESGRWPVESGSISLCLSDNVLEHLADPEDFFSECSRVLAPGGYLCIRTPNVFSYFGLLSKLVPNRAHPPVLARVKEGTREQDVFPTLYRCNTLWCVRKKMEQFGFEACVYGYDAEPSYLSFSRILYFLGVLHQRWAPNFIKVGIHAFGVKR